MKRYLVVSSIPDSGSVAREIVVVTTPQAAMAEVRARAEAGVSSSVFEEIRRFRPGPPEEENVNA